MFTVPDDGCFFQIQVPEGMEVNNRKESCGDDDNKQLEKILASERCNKHCNEPNSTIYERAVIESCRCDGRAQDTVIPRMQQVDDGVVAVMC